MPIGDSNKSNKPKAKPKPKSKGATSKKEEWDEPKKKWGKSKAQKLLCVDTSEGRVPRKAKDKKGRSTTKLRTICDSRPEFQKCHCSKFSSRLSSLRKAIDDKLKRKDIDQAAHDNCRANHAVICTSAKG